MLKGKAAMRTISINDYLESKKPVWSATTYTATRSRLKHYDSKLTPTQLYEKLVNKPYGKYYIKTVFINIANFMDWSAEQGCSNINEYKKFMADCPQLFRNVYEDKYTDLTLEGFLEEYNEATGAFKDVLALLGFAGCRLCELYTFDGISVLGKGNKRRRVYLPIPIANNPLTLSESYIRKRLRYNPHSYRKLAADTLLRNGVDIKSIQTVLGHASITATQRYLRPMKEEEMQQKVSSIYGA